MNEEGVDGPFQGRRIADECKMDRQEVDDIDQEKYLGANKELQGLGQESASEFS